MKNISISGGDLCLILSSLESSKEIADIAINTAISNGDFHEAVNGLHVLYRVCSLYNKISDSLNEEEN